jgi:hypothetical protein
VCERFDSRDLRPPLHALNCVIDLCAGVQGSPQKTPHALPRRVFHETFNPRRVTRKGRSDIAPRNELLRPVVNGEFDLWR